MGLFNHIMIFFADEGVDFPVEAALRQKELTFI
jgi:hypothetical protein